MNLTTLQTRLRLMFGTELVKQRIFARSFFMRIQLVVTEHRYE